MTLPIALQLHTVRDEMDADVEKTLDRVAAIGYRHVEIDAFHSRTPQQLRACCNGLGLSITSLHTPYDALSEDLARQIAAARTLGCNYLVCTSIPPHLRNPKGYRQAVTLLSQLGVRAADEGVTICYHNHGFEFERLDDGTRGMDVLFAEGEAPACQAQLDVYWVAHGGGNPLAWMWKLRGRLDLLHVKDMTEDRRFIEIGRGTLDFDAIVCAAGAAQVRSLIIEQDTDWDRSPLESARCSFENLTKIQNRQAGVES